jgi:hypothetical protein
MLERINISKFGVYSYIHPPPTPLSPKMAFQSFVNTILRHDSVIIVAINYICVFLHFVIGNMR